jgi:hypothetical protein
LIELGRPTQQWLGSNQSYSTLQNANSLCYSLSKNDAPALPEDAADHLERGAKGLEVAAVAVIAGGHEINPLQKRVEVTRDDVETAAYIGPP